MKQVTIISIVGFTSGMTSPAFLEETMLCQDHCIGNVQDLMEAGVWKVRQQHGRSYTFMTRLGWVDF